LRAKRETFLDRKPHSPIKSRGTGYLMLIHLVLTDEHACSKLVKSC